MPPTSELSHEQVSPMFYGTSELLRWDAPSALSLLDAHELFRCDWGGGSLDAAEFARVRERDFEPTLEALTREISAQGLLDCNALYGIFPVATSDTRLIVLDPSDHTTELAAFVFPRIPEAGDRSIADYFAPEGDALGILAATIGRGLNARADQYAATEENRLLGLRLVGIATQLAADLSERVTVELRRALGVPVGQGCLHSFGEPGLPGTDHLASVFEFMAIEERLGIVPSPDFRLTPEHSTVGLFVHHPEAERLGACAE